MAKKWVADLLALAGIIVFLIAIYLLPPLKQAFLDILCYPEDAIFKLSFCSYGPLLFYMFPFFCSCWLLIRFSIKLTKFASLVDEDSYVCKAIGSVYEKVKALDG